MFRPTSIFTGEKAINRVFSISGPETFNAEFFIKKDLVNKGEDSDIHNYWKEQVKPHLPLLGDTFSYFVGEITVGVNGKALIVPKGSKILVMVFKGTLESDTKLQNDVIYLIEGPSTLYGSTNVLVGMATQ